MSTAAADVSHENSPFDGIHFEVIQKRGGGFAAWCHDLRIYIDSLDLEDLYEEMTEKLKKSFNDTIPALDKIKLAFYRE